MGILAQERIQLVKAVGLGEGHKVPTPGIAHQVLHTAFLPAGMRIGENGFIAVDTVKVAEPLLLLAGVAAKEVSDRWLEIVVDHTSGHSTPKLKRPALA